MIHTHSIHSVALTLQGVWKASDVVPPITPYFVMKVGYVPLVPYHRPGHLAVAEHVADATARSARDGAPICAVLLDRLGSVTWHESPTAAMAVLEKLEETARLWTICHPRPQPLPEPAIEELRRTFGSRW